VFENRELRRIPKRDEVMGGWRKQHKEELCDLYSLPGIIRMIKWRDEIGRPCRTNGGKAEHMLVIGGKEVTWKTKTWVGG
jgi:hypothetical protein